MNLAGIDLNLLVAFDALMEERNVTRAGRRVGLSQSAMSNALQRLRAALGDELFVRAPDGMRPTPRAEDLTTPLRRALLDIRGALDAAGFDPTTPARRFTLSLGDYATAVLGAPLAGLVRAGAPGVDLRVIANSNKEVPAQLDAGEADLAQAWFPAPPARLMHATLYEESYVCVMRPDHPLAEGPLTLERYASWPHLLISPRGDDAGFADEALAQYGLSRRVAMTVPHFTAALLVVARSDLISTVPKRIAGALPGNAGLRVRELPYKSFRVPITLFWHPRVDSHPAHRWLRGLLVEAARAGSPVDSGEGRRAGTAG